MTKALTFKGYMGSNPWKILDAYNCNLYPSVVKDSYNLKNKARFYIIEESVLGHLFFNNGESIWTLSSKKTLDEKIITSAIVIAKKADKNFTELNVVSKNKLPENLPDNTTIKSLERAEYEYIYKTKPTLLLKSRNYLTPRRYVNKFIKLYGEHLTIDIYKDDSDSHLNGEINDLYQSWLEHTSMPKEDLLHETNAFNNYIKKRDIKS